VQHGVGISPPHGVHLTTSLYGASRCPTSLVDPPWWHMFCYKQLLYRRSVTAVRSPLRGADGVPPHRTDRATSPTLHAPL